jgi:hypothetical protein
MDSSQQQPPSMPQPVPLFYTTGPTRQWSFGETAAGMALFHLVLTAVLLFFGMSYDVGLHSTDDPLIVSTTSHWAFIALSCPAHFLRLCDGVPDAILAIAGIANSFLWGFALAYLIFRIRRRPIRAGA